MNNEKVFMSSAAVVIGALRVKDGPVVFDEESFDTVSCTDF